VIELKKFGTTLISRQTGKEAFLACQSLLQDIKKTEMIELDFKDVLSFSVLGRRVFDALVKKIQRELDSKKNK